MAGIYIHVPFCKTRCIYCDFYTRTDLSSRKDYIEAICNEIKLRRDYTGDDVIKTIYFGGGTPSLLKPDDLELIFGTIYDNFTVDKKAEITLEANPDDLNSDYLQGIKKLPFNRLSIGIQSFDDKELSFLRRRHSASQAKEAVKLSQAGGFENISIDLMYGLPGQTMDIWQKNLDEAINLNIQHISSYHLIYEEGTRLFRLYEQGGVNPVNEDLSLEMFSMMIDKLSNAGFRHYEISNFARNGLYSQHNSSYWLGEKYLGLGPAAHSYDGKNRAWNVASISKYLDGIKQQKPAIETEYLDENTRYNDFVLTGLRTMWGVDLIELDKQFGTRLLEYALSNAKKHIDGGYLLKSDNILTFTRKGIFISDGIMSDLMWID